MLKGGGGCCFRWLKNGLLNSNFLRGCEGSLELSISLNVKDVFVSVSNKARCRSVYCVLFVLEISPTYWCRKPGTWRGKDEFREQHLFERHALQLHHGTDRRKGRGVGGERSRVQDVVVECRRPSGTPARQLSAP